GRAPRQLDRGSAGGPSGAPARRGRSVLPRVGFDDDEPAAADHRGHDVEAAAHDVPGPAERRPGRLGQLRRGLLRRRPTCGQAGPARPPRRQPGGPADRADRPDSLRRQHEDRQGARAGDPAGGDGAGGRSHPVRYKAYAVSWNLTQRCNLFCAHCYISAAPRASAAGELTTAECRRVMADIARVNPGTFLILTGGEPLLRPDIFDLTAEGREHGFTVVVGTNGVLLREKQARLMKTHGVQGASVSLDSTDPARHDEFRHLPGAWRAAVRATEVLRAEAIDFSLHMSVTDWNVGEIPAMIDLAREVGARVLNFFFLVRTGRGEGLTDITPAQYEEILTYLARAQGAGGGADGLG